jgi:hypothetical protein
MTTHTMTNTAQARQTLIDPVSTALIDSAAARLYLEFTLCPNCTSPMTLADVLRFRCAHCGALTLAGKGPDISQERGAQMLDELRARRVQLGLPE